jgi:hypothetical protein
MKIIKKKAIQVHPVPDRVMDPRGPFPSELFAEPVIVDSYLSALDEDGSSFPLGATAQNNFNPPKHVRCALCLTRVLDSEKENHICEE